MAKIKGTNGDDTLVGTSGDDNIWSYLGMDSVDGGAGYDVLTIDYSAVTSSVFPGNMTLSSAGSWSGGVSSGVNGGPVNVTAFQNVERIVYTGSQDVDYLSVDLGTLALEKSRLALSGGGDDDVLAIRGWDVDTATALTLVVTGDGSINSNVGTLSGWYAFDIALGLATGNKVVLGGGDDVVRSSGGRDTIDLGAGYDTWEGSYGSYASAIAFTASPTGGIVATGAKPLAKVSGAEVMSATLGTADDTADVTNASGWLWGGGGQNSLIYRSQNQTIAATLSTNTFGELTGQVARSGDPTTPFHFGQFQTALVAGGLGNDAFTLDASTYAVADGVYDTILDGSSGVDTLLLDLRAEAAGYVGASDFGIRSGVVGNWGVGIFLEFRDIETLTVRFGAGNDLVQGGLTTDTRVDGGAGEDTIDFGALGAKITVDLGNTASQAIGFGAQFVTLANVEDLRATASNDTITDSAAGNVIQAGAGNDLVVSSAASTGGADTFYGEAGTDTIDYHLATGGITISLALTAAQATGGAGTDTLLSFENVTGSGFADTLSGGSGDNVLAGGDGNDVLEGLGGNDTLNGGAGTDTASYAHATAAVSVSLAASGAQNTGGAGTDTLTGIENLTGSAYADTLVGNSANNVLTGGLETDVLTGGGGADRFVFRSAAETSVEFLESDLITDFQGPSRVAGDVIDLSGIDAVSSTTRFNDTFTFIGAAAFTGAAGQLRAYALGDDLFFVTGDTNGDKTGDFGIYVQSTDTALVKADFVL